METIKSLWRTADNGITMNTLKYIAIIAMVVDHLSYAYLSEYSAPGIITHFIGRTTAPIMFYAAVEGYHHTSNIRKYLIRLAVFALVSMLPFSLFSYSVNNIEELAVYQSVIYTIFMGVLGIYIRRGHFTENYIIRYLLIFILALLCIPADWSYLGFIMIITFDYYYGSFKHQFVAYCLVVTLGYNIFDVFVEPINSYLYGFKYDSYIYVVKHAITYTGALVPMILLSFYKGERGRKSSFTKWFFYIFYPAHLLLLAIIKMYVV